MNRQVSNIAAEDRKRLEGAAGPPIRATYGIFTFESPTPRSADAAVREAERREDKDRGKSDGQAAD